MADDAVAVLDAAGVESAHVIGMSMGGYIAQELVLRHRPGRVRSLVRGCTSCGGSRGGARRPGKWGSAMAARGEGAPRDDASGGMVPYTFDASGRRASGIAQGSGDAAAGAAVGKTVISRSSRRSGNGPDRTIG